MDTADRHVGKQIERLRIGRGLNQAQFAELVSSRGLHWSQRTVSRLESGERSMKYTEAFALAAALDLAPEEVAPPTMSVDHHYRRQLAAMRAAERDVAVARGVLTEEQARAHAWRLIFEIKQGSSKSYTVRGTVAELVNSLSLADPQGRWVADQVPWSAIFGAVGVDTASIDAAAAQADADADAILRGDTPSTPYPHTTGVGLGADRFSAESQTVRGDLVRFGLREHLFGQLLERKLVAVEFAPRPDSGDGFGELLIDGIDPLEGDAR